MWNDFFFNLFSHPTGRLNKMLIHRWYKHQLYPYFYTYILLAQMNLPISIIDWEMCEYQRNDGMHTIKKYHCTSSLHATQSGFKVFYFDFIDYFYNFYLNRQSHRIDHVSQSKPIHKTWMSSMHLIKNSFKTYCKTTLISCDSCIVQRKFGKEIIIQKRSVIRLSAYLFNCVSYVIHLSWLWLIK